MTFFEKVADRSDKASLYDFRMLKDITQLKVVLFRSGRSHLPRTNLGADVDASAAHVGATPLSHQAIPQLHDANQQAACREECVRCCRHALDGCPHHSPESRTANLIDDVILGLGRQERVGREFQVQRATLKGDVDEYAGY